MRNPAAQRLALVALAVLVLLPGCVRRRLMIRSNPAGALVYVDNEQVGVTPCAASFTYYGTREIRLVKPGYETLTVSQPVPPPWYQVPPLDFVSEVLYPRKVQDFRTLTYSLSPQVIVPTDQLLARAEQLRANTQQGAVVPAAASVPEGTPATGPLLPPQGTIFPETIQPGSLPPGGTVLEPLPPP
ncbi:MAG: PEGA domain-containing protein [Planctomycetota bacterium]